MIQKSLSLWIHHIDRGENNNTDCWAVTGGLVAAHILEAEMVVGHSKAAVYSVIFQSREMTKEVHSEILELFD